MLDKSSASQIVLVGWKPLVHEKETFQWCEIKNQYIYTYIKQILRNSPCQSLYTACTFQAESQEEHQIHLEKKRRIKYRENHSCSNKLTYIQHYLTIICKLQLNRKAIKILFNTMKDPNEDAAWGINFPPNLYLELSWLYGNLPN